MNRGIRLAYPATITTRSSRWSSMAFSSVSIASWPKSLYLKFSRYRLEASALGAALLHIEAFIQNL